MSMVINIGISKPFACFSLYKYLAKASTNNIIMVLTAIEPCLNQIV